MEKENNKLRFTLMWSSCLCVLLLMVGLGVSSSVKGTSAASACPTGTTEASNNSDYCCKNASDKVYISSGKAYCSSANVVANGSGYSCTKSTSGSTANYTSWNTVDWDAFCAGINGTGWSHVDGSYSSSVNGSGTTMCSADISVCGYLASSKVEVTEYCYECNSDTNLLYWGVSSGSAPFTCGGGWHQTSVSKSNCKTNLLTANLNANGGSISSTKATCYAKVGGGCYVSPGIPSFEGHTFNGWATSTSACSSASSSVRITSDTTLVACWTSNVDEKTWLSVEFNPNGGKLSGSSTGGCYSYGDGCNADADTPSFEGHTFKGWATSTSNCPSSYFSSVPLKNAKTTYVACWEEEVSESKDVLTVTFDASSTGGIIYKRECEIPKGTSGINSCSITVPDGSWYVVHKDGDSASDVYCYVDDQVSEPVKGGETVSVTIDMTYRTCKSGGSGGNPTSPSTPDDDNNEPSSSSKVEEPSSSSKVEEPSSSVEKEEPSSDTNVEENPPTSEIAIFIVWVVAAMAIVYSIWYFKQVREN